MLRPFSKHAIMPWRILLHVWTSLHNRRFRGNYQWLMPQLTKDSNGYIFQQDGCPAHYHRDVQGYLDQNLPQRWIGCRGQEDDTLMQWPPSRIFAAVALVNHDMLTCMQNEMDYHIDVCHYNQRWTHWASVKYVKKTLSVFQCNKIWSPFRSLFTANFLNVSWTYQ
jgi:hypothetical protein